MELDDFKNRNFKDKNSGNIDNQNLNLIIDALKEADKNQRRKTFITITFLIALAVIYLSLQQRSTPDTKLGLIMCVSGFISGAIYLYFRYRALPAKFYNLSTEEVLKKSRERLEYFKFYDYLIITPILIILGTGGGFILTDRLLRYTDNLTLVISIWVAFFILLCIFGFYAGKKNWEKEHGKLYREIEELLKNF